MCVCLTIISILVSAATDVPLRHQFFMFCLFTTRSASFLVKKKKKIHFGRFYFLFIGIIFRSAGSVFLANMEAPLRELGKSRDADSPITVAPVCVVHFVERGRCTSAVGLAQKHKPAPLPSGRAILTHFSLMPFPFQSPVKNGTPSLLSSFSSSTTSGSSSSSSLVSMASVVGGIIPVVPTSSSLIGSFSSAVQQHQHPPAQQQQQNQQQPPLAKPGVPSNSTPSPPSNPLLPASTAPSLPTPSTPISSAPNALSQPTSGSTPTSALGLGLGLGLSKGSMTGTSGGNQMPGLGLGGHPTPLNSMAGHISGSTPAPYAQAAASSLGLSSTTQSSISVESSTSVTTSGSSGVTSNGAGAGAGAGLGLLGSSPAHGSISGSILGLVPGQNVSSGASQMPPSSVSASPGVVGMMGGNGGSVGLVGGVGAAPARPPSGLKQNGSTSTSPSLLSFPSGPKPVASSHPPPPTPPCLLSRQVTAPSWQKVPQNQLSAHRASHKAASPRLSVLLPVSRELGPSVFVRLCDSKLRKFSTDSREIFRKCCVLEPSGSGKLLKDSYSL